MGLGLGNLQSGNKKKQWGGGDPLSLGSGLCHAAQYLNFCNSAVLSVSVDTLLVVVVTWEFVRGSWLGCNKRKK